MIRSEKKYKEALHRLKLEKKLLSSQEARLKGIGLTGGQIKQAMEPIRSLHQQLNEDIQTYEGLKRGHLEEMVNLQGLGRALVALRIARKLTHRELAERLGIHASQISRDERHQYRGITLERAGRILEALGVEMRSRVKLA